MAGRPKRRAMLERMRLKGGAKWFFEEVANGRSIYSLAEELETSRWELYNWINGAERNKRAYHTAQLIGADARIERAEWIADREPTDDNRVKVARDQLRTDWHKYMASVLNPEVYGKKESRDVNISITALHLDALRNRVAEEQQIIDQANQQALPASYRKQEVIEAEIVEEK